MFYFGIRRRKLETIDDRTGKCPHCQSFQVEHLVIQNYFHVWFIPVFPTGQTIETRCSTCGGTSAPGQHGAMTQEQVRMQKARRTPIWTFSGSLVLAILVTIGIYGSMRESESLKYMESPLAGDIYLMEDETGLGYSYYRIEHIDQEGLHWISSSTSWSAKKTDIVLNEHKFADAYSWVPYTLEKIGELRTSGRVDKVIRKNKTYQADMQLFNQIYSSGWDETRENSAGTLGESLGN